jgi:archaetidylinositol phosphate synthase
LLEKADIVLTKLKQRVQAVLTAEAKAAHMIGLTPNSVSIIGVILAFFSAIAYTQWQADRLYLLLAIALLLVSGFCDVLDGIVARLYRQETPFGGFMDSLLDRYADAAVYMGIIISGLCDPIWGLTALAGSMLVSYSRARAEAANVKMEMVGIAERAERIIILIIASMIAIYWEPPTTMNAAIILLAILTNLTVLQRSIYAYRKLEKKEANLA